MPAAIGIAQNPSPSTPVRSGSMIVPESPAKKVIEITRNPTAKSDAAKAIHLSWRRSMP